MLTLCCVRGEDANPVFDVDISKEAGVGRLKATLKHGNPDTFKDVDAKDLELYSLFIPSNADRTVELGNWRSHGNEPLDVRRKLADAFPRTQDGEWVVVISLRAPPLLHDKLILTPY
ncbi:hypothetical protein BKA83DRAFT_4055780 [Pisolithus microcarpus]|nr:hypothetical protein BKA83DRAFT_4055780 [Pisolithus microcarpus]